MIIQNIKKRILLVLFLPIFFINSGCDTEEFDLETAKQFGEQAISFEQHYELIIKDFYQSCLRHSRYSGFFSNNHDRGIKGRTFREHDCIRFAKLENDLLKAHAILAQYTEAFRELSSDKVIEELDGAGQLAEALASSAAAPPEISALKPLLKELANAIQKALSDAYRRQVLQESVQEVNVILQEYIVILSEITRVVYETRLKLEEKAMREYYSTIISQELDKSEVERQINPVQVSVILVDQQWQEEQKNINFPQRRARIESYLESLKVMANLHQKLFTPVEYHSN
ncbi:MAG TPA: hypothetical protein DCF68_00700 [Cyanothece sp. UBA12306]|nr:hypothetical protein [Cyanothece sp. UBA12306]